MTLLTILAVVAISGLLSLLLTGVYRYWALTYHITSEPNERSLHSSSTPVGGGLAFVAVWFLGLLYLYLNGVVDQSLFFAMLCGLLLAAVSLLDDVVQVKPIIRLLVQFGVAVAAFYFLGGLRKPLTPGLEALSLPYITYPLAILGMVWFINLYNFMDGADGFASVEAITVSLVLFVFVGSTELLVLAAVVLGFLFWNRPKAKIFMGDVGSTQLGFILVVLGIHYHNTLDFSIFNWLMITSPFWFDATYTLYRRWRRGENLSKAHRKHAYQRFILAGNSHARLILMMLLLNLIIFLLILVYRQWLCLKIPVYLLTLSILYLLTRKIDSLYPFSR